MTVYSDKQMEMADPRSRAYMRDINRLDDESRALAKSLIELACKADMLVGGTSTIGPGNAAYIVHRSLDQLKTKLEHLHESLDDAREALARLECTHGRYDCITAFKDNNLNHEMCDICKAKEDARVPQHAKALRTQLDTARGHIAALVVAASTPELLTSSIVIGMAKEWLANNKPENRKP